MREQYHAVADDRVCRSKQRRVVENKERDRTERAENHGRNRETHKIASAVCLKERPEPKSCASIPLTAPLLMQVRKISSGNFIAVKTDCSGARQSPMVAP